MAMSSIYSNPASPDIDKGRLESPSVCFKSDDLGSSFRAYTLGVSRGLRFVYMAAVRVAKSNLKAFWKCNPV